MDRDAPTASVDLTRRCKPSVFAFYLKEIAEEVCHALTIILRKSLDQGEIPEDWRIANVSPIFKKEAGVKHPIIVQLA